MAKTIFQVCGMIAGFGYEAWGLIQTATAGIPTTSVIHRWDLVAVFFVFIGFVTWTIIDRELQLKKIREARPEVVLKSAYVQHRNWIDPNLNVVTGNPSFALIKVANDPVNKTEEATDKHIWAEIIYYDDKLTKPYKIVRGRWSSVTQPDTLPPHAPLDNLDEVELNSNGRPQELAIALKYTEDEDFYCFNNESYQFPTDARNPNLKLSHNIVKVCVIIKGEKTTAKKFYFYLYNRGKHQDIEISTNFKSTSHKKNYRI